MTNAETKHLELALQAKRQELIGKICGRAGELHIDVGEGDIVDRTQRMADRDQTAAMLSRLSSTLADVDRSLRTLSERSYGLCADCEKEIGLKRLQIIPWAAYCLQCQERFESVQKARPALYSNAGQAA